MSGLSLQLDGLHPSLRDYTGCDYYRVPVMPCPPSLDGPVREDEWQYAVRFDGFSFYSRLEERHAVGYIGATRTHLYIAIITELPPTGQLLDTVRIHSDQLVWDDAVEVWIDAEPDADSGVTFQMLANAHGIDAYQTFPRGEVRQEAYYGWQGHFRFANSVHDGAWHCQIEIPLEAIAPGRRITDGCWMINLCRDFKAPWAFAALGNINYQLTETRFRFVDDGCVVQMRHQSDPTTRDISAELTIYNPTASTLTSDALLFLQRDLMPEVTSEERLEIPAGECRRLRLAVEERVANRFSLFAMVRDAGGNSIYSRAYAWGPARANRWEVRQQDRAPVDMRYAYYPTLNLLRVAPDFSGLAPEAHISAFSLILISADGTIVFEQQYAPDALLQEGGEITMTLPPLDGVYQLALHAEGDGVPDEAVVKRLQRTVYAWEQQGLGISRRVYPPFTPITVEGRTLGTVLKEYDLNGFGLLDQLRSMDQQGHAYQELLARPMRYTAVIDGEAVESCPMKMSWLEQAEDRVVVSTESTCGGLKLHAITTLEYDGMLRVDLTLDASSPFTLDAFDLQIPLHAASARMFHAMADGLRYPILTTTIPSGEGVVWSSSQLKSSEFPENFCTYIFLGDASRGLCWFAENDRGWGWDHAQANLDLLREDDTITLRVHLVNQPVEIAQARTLTFGIQGAPVKPRLAGWRHRWFTDNFSVVGCDEHWLSTGTCGSFYPAGKDLFLWEMLRRGNCEHLSDAEIAEVVRRGTAHVARWGTEHVEWFTRMAQANLRNRYGTTMIFYYNRSIGADVEEYQTFADEWGLHDYNPERDHPLPYEIKVVPSSSYIDFTLYWFGQSFDTAGNTGVYVDNNFFAASRNQLMTGAYTRDDGAVIPSTGIWGLREFAKRTFVYLHERGMDPLTMVHTTSTQILPINAFYTLQYDWEWHFSEGDVQDRFSDEYLQLVSSGEHLGAWPIVLHEQGKSIGDPWVQRTFMAVCLVHELIIDPYIWDETPVDLTADTTEARLHQRVRMPILSLVQHPEVEVYRYWDARPLPITISHAKVRAILFVHHAQEVICVLTSYAKADVELTVRFDTRMLGLIDGIKVTNLETGDDLAVCEDSISFTLRKHDFQAFRITPSFA